VSFDAHEAILKARNVCSRFGRYFNENRPAALARSRDSDGIWRASAALLGLWPLRQLATHPAKPQQAFIAAKPRDRTLRQRRYARL